ncbi:cytochrome p450 monooxygenase [Xylariales sp. AK1849]|nr:cytochrome p450 monooxygenase [Xylariales sp. AK1849]
MYSFSLPALVVGFFFLYFILRPLVNYFRDPKGFRKYPSLNALAGISNLGYMYEAITKPLRSQHLYELHKKHPVIRIGPNSLSFAGGQAIKDIYGHGAPNTKDTFYATLAGTHYHLADVVDKPEHARKRKVLSAAYALKNLETWEHKVADKTERFIRAADRACSLPFPSTMTKCDVAGPTFDYRKYSNFFSLDAISDIGLSESLGFLDQGDDLTTGEAMDGTLRQVHYREALHSTALAQTHLVWAYDWFKFNTWLSKIISPRHRKMWKLNENWNDIVYHRARKRLARYEAGEKLEDFFQALMEDRNGQAHNLDWGEIVAEVSIMLNAGSDTTALAMVNVMYHLLKHPEVMKKLREEVDTVLGPEEIVASYDKVKYLPYLRAVLDESLRITPPTSFGLPRRTPPEGCAVASEFIPGDTTVSISAYVAHRDESVFPEPEKFIPERWLGDNGRELQAGFVAFSTGARGCIGRNISYLEQTVLLASVVHRYEMALPSMDWEPERWESTNYMIRDLPVKIWRRNLEGGEEKLAEIV